MLTAVRLGLTVAEAGEQLLRQCRAVFEIAAGNGRAVRRAPKAMARTLEIADRSTFSLDELRYEYPEELAPPGETPLAYLARLTWAGARKRYPDGVPEKVRELLEHELALIAELHYEAYFLTVWDLVRFARERGILCQGRGSAANSAVCYLPGRHGGRSRAGSTCCSSGSSAASGTRRPTSTSTSSTSGARRCCSISTRSTAASGPA